MNILYMPDGNIIARGPYTETETEYVFADQIVPKVVVPKCAFADVDAPDGFIWQNYRFENGALVLVPTTIDTGEP